jgi:hypothetical protein
MSASQTETLVQNNHDSVVHVVDEDGCSLHEDAVMTLVATAEISKL